MVRKTVNMCNNHIAIAVVKAVVFGEKFLQTLVVTTQDAIFVFYNWIDSGIEKYKNRN